MRIYNANKDPYLLADPDVTANNSAEHSTMTRVIVDGTKLIPSRGFASNVVDHLEQLIRSDTRLQLAGNKTFWVPVKWDGAHPGASRGAEVGSLMATNCLVRFTV